MRKILVINGPNLNLLGKREPGVYGGKTLDELETQLDMEAVALGIEADFLQTSYEGDIVDAIITAKEKDVEAIILNAGAYTHYSYAIRDAIAGTKMPVVEVHISNVHAREDFRHQSVIAPVCLGQITGLGFDSYSAALFVLARRMDSVS